MGALAPHPARGRGRPAHLPGRGRRAEHLLHPGVRAVRGRPVRHGCGRRQPPPVRVPLPQPRLDHAGDPDPGHPPCDADLPPRLSGERAGRASPAVHAGLGRGRGAGRVAVQRSRGSQPRADGRGCAGAAPALCPRARRRGQVRAHRLALPRDAGRHRPCPGLGAGGGHVLPRHRPRQPAGFPGQGQQPADGALFDHRAGGDARRRMARPSPSATRCWSTTCTSTMR